MRRLTAVLACAGFVLTVYLANWLVQHVGPVRVWPTSLLAPAGVYCIGLAFLLRDTVQRFSGQVLALAGVAGGTLLSAFLVSGRLALASATAFAASEIVGLVIFWAGGGRTAGSVRLTPLVVASSAAAAALDSYVFLSIAFGSLAFFDGQVVAKLSVTALALPVVLLARKRYPTRPALEMGR